MRITKRALVPVSLVAAVSVALAGCVGGGSSGGGGEVTYWGAFYAPTTEEAFQEIFVDGFNADSDAKVDMEVKELTTIGQLTETAVSAGEAPDIVYSDGPTSASDFARADRTLPLDEYAEEYGWEEKFLPWAYELSTVDGKVSSVPASYGSMALFYNAEVFEEHGWTPPTTLAEFETIAEEADEAGMVPLGGGNAGYQGMNEWLVTAVFNAAVGPEKIYDVLTGEASFTDPEFVSAIELIQSWIDKGWLAGGSESYFTTDDTANVTGLANGTTAMYVSGTWTFNSLSEVFEDPAQWAWAPLPSLNESVDPGVFPLAIGTALSVSADAADPDAAASFIDYVTGDVDRALSYTARTGENPPPLEMSADQFPEDVDERSVELYTQIPETSNVGYATWTFFPPQTNAYLISEFDKIVTGDLTAEEYLSGMQDAFDEEFDAGETLVPFTPQGRG
ncbi:carbohydrate ABC transporter substrate-binding protein (CUT1 family) [Promicromonospora sp. AC04]|uniref:ABC transporter substrate-binding protein n=1 Tax=Promicromonospora sp. AC04 TaxID=2135723 RepID=UPI000D46D9A0|nr:extracellular solute-binding protein [Promicromonospora sp. AC04]PUB25264.1 carbohydrate ABC transporter substrate-binding protein (CUT1 family) [Promicromonospora sp. AC04]